jgi:hypothetical protein
MGRQKQKMLIWCFAGSGGLWNHLLLAQSLQRQEQRKAILCRASPVESTILHACLNPFIIATSVEKVAILQAATDEHNVIQDEALVI